MKSKKRVPVDGESIPWKSPFAGLKALDIPVRPTPPEKVVPMDEPSVPIRSNRGRVDIIRQTAHRGGKVVTVVTGWTGIGQPEKERLAQVMQKACGAGGTVKEGRIEIQGDQRTVVARILTEAGFRPVFAGG